MSNKNEATREQARQILKKGILDMSIARLIQMARYGLMGNIEVAKGRLFTKTSHTQNRFCTLKIQYFS